MAAPKGNKYGRGKKGASGRKSAYQEKADAEFLHKVFFGELSPEEIREKLKSGTYSVRDKWVEKLLEGNEAYTRQLVQKLFPDMLKVEEDVTIKIDI